MKQTKPAKQRQFTPAWRLATAVVIVLALAAHFKLYTYWGAGFGGSKGNATEQAPVAVRQIAPEVDRSPKISAVRPARREEPVRPPAVVSANVRPSSKVEAPVLPIAGRPSSAPDDFPNPKDALRLVGRIKGSHLVFSIQNLSPKAIANVNVSVWTGKGEDKPTHTFDVPLVAGKEIIQGDIDMGVEGSLSYGVRLRVEEAKYERGS